MKKYISVLLLTLVSSVSIHAQNSAPAVPVTKDVVAAVPAPVREKFDPTRDPKVDLEKAVAQAAKSKKHIILDIGGEWCSWCVFMDKFFVPNPDLGKLREDNFIWVKVNYSEENENTAFLSPYPERPGYPHLYVLDETGKLLHSEDTSVLEKGKGYDLEKLTEFLKAWSPKKTTAAH